MPTSAYVQDKVGRDEVGRCGTLVQANEKPQQEVKGTLRPLLSIMNGEVSSKAIEGIASRNARASH